MTGAEFIQRVKVKLNRIDTNSYQDIRPEEVLFFGDNALKTLTLLFDIGQYSGLVDESAIKIYLASLITKGPELNLVNNEVNLPSNVLKLKDTEVFVTVGTESGWMPTRFLTNEHTSDRQDNMFTKSYPDTPVFRLIGGNIKFDTFNFTCSKVRYDYLKVPIVIEELSQLVYPFINELEDKTVTLILENLESRRLQTQSIVSKS